MGKRKRSRDEESISSSDSEKENKKLRKEIKSLKRELKKRKEKKRRKRSSSQRSESSTRDVLTAEKETSTQRLSMQSSKDSVEADIIITSANKTDSLAGAVNTAAMTATQGQPSLASSGNVQDPPEQLIPEAIVTEVADILEKPEHETELEEEILNVLGPRLEPDAIRGPAIHKDLASRWTDVLKKGLNSEELKKLTETYPPPENCSSMEAPKLNLEVKAAVQEATITRDNRIVEKQKRIAACLTAIGNSVSLVLKIADPAKLKLLEHLSAAGRLLAAIQRDETTIRKSLILTNLNASIKETLSSTTADEWLFGHDLEEKLKTAKSLERTSKDLKTQPKPQQNKNSKNSKAPLRQSNFKSEQSTSKTDRATAGGNKKTYTSKPYQSKPYAKKEYHQSGKRH